MTVKNNAQLKSLATLLALGGVLVAAVGLIYLFFTPKSYQASVEIRLRNWNRSDSTNNVQSTYGISTECQVACSEAILGQAIANLNLNELWGKRLNQGVPLKSPQSIILLKAKAVARPIPNSSLFQIEVSSEDREETAKIANEIARIYQQKRTAEHQALNVDKVAVFQQKWDEENKKVQSAQAALDKMYLDITRNKTTNPATMYEVIMAKRVELESRYVEQRDELATLRAMTTDQLKQVLPTLDPNPKSLLATTLNQRSKARTDLVIAQSTYAADAPELKHAVLVLDEVDKSIARTINGIMEFKQHEVDSSKAALDDINEKLNRASANVKEIAAQDLLYNQAKQDVEHLKMKRDAIQEKMNQQEAHDALMPAVAIPEIIDSADPPQKPAVPDGKIAASTIGAGSFAALSGLFLLLMIPKPKTASGKN